MIAVTLKTIKAAILVLGIKILEIPAHRMFVSSGATPTLTPTSRRKLWLYSLSARTTF